MSRTATVHSRIEAKIKSRAEKILKTVGLGSSDAINMFYRQIILRNGIPFPVEIPNEDTIKAINDAESNKNLKAFNSVEELIKSLNS